MFTFPGEDQGVVESGEFPKYPCEQSCVSDTQPLATYPCVRIPQTPSGFPEENPLVPNQTPPPVNSDAPFRPHADRYPGLSVEAVQWLYNRSNQRLNYAYTQHQVLIPVFFKDVDESQPVAVLRTHLEQATSAWCNAIEVLVAICSFAPAKPGPRLINELVCDPQDYDRAIGEMTIPRVPPAPATGLRGMRGYSPPKPLELSADELSVDTWPANEWATDALPADEQTE